MPSSPPETSNQLISALPIKVRNDILRQCETVDLSLGDVLYEANQPLRFLYFPLSGFISMLTTTDKDETLGMGLIGNEGMFGSTLAIDIDRATTQILVQGNGESLRLTVSQMRRLLREWPVLNKLLSFYQYVVMEQMIQSANCRCVHLIQQRLARWLLMFHDRIRGDTLQLTHKLLALMLGVRRSGITVAAGDLQDSKLINYRRGKIIILNRKGLEVVSCQCYRKMNQVYAQYVR